MSKHIPCKYLLLTCLITSLAAFSTARAASLFFDFESDINNDDRLIISTSQPDYLWQDGDTFCGWDGVCAKGFESDGFLSITEATGSTRSTIIFPQGQEGEVVSGFTVSAMLRIGNGTTVRPADGFSVSFASSDDPVILSDGASGFAGGPPENGTTTGVAVNFDTWQGNALPDGGDIEGIIVRANNKTLIRQDLPTRHGDCDDITSLQTGPRDSEFPGSDPTGLCWQPFVMTVGGGTLTVNWKNNAVLDAAPIEFVAGKGQLVLAGRTGGANEFTHFDNLSIETTTADTVTITSVASRVDGFNVVITDVGTSVLNPDSVVLSLDGVEVTATSVTKSGDDTTVVYDHGEFFAPNSTHVIGVAAADTNGTQVTQETSFTSPDYAVVGAEFNVGNAGLSDRGFTGRVLQANTGLANNNALREQHLAGLLTDGNGDPLENFIDDFSVPIGGEILDPVTGEFTLDNWVNFDQDGANQGVFQDTGAGDNTDVFDDFIPGIPGLEGSTDNITMEILCVVCIPEAGLYNFAFNSDDGFKTTAGNTGDASEAILIATFDGGRGAATTFGTALFEEAGYYKLRSIWYEGGGGANLEWWTAEADGTPIALLNDTDNGGLETYRNIPDDPFSVISVSPSDGQSELPAGGTTITVIGTDGSTSLDTDSVTGTFNGAAITPNVASDGGNHTITYDTGELMGNTEYAWEFNFTVSGNPRTVGASFRTTVLAGEGLLFVETEDFDYEQGKWDEAGNIGLAGAYPGGTYQDLGDGIDETDVDAGTDFGIDYFETNNANAQAVYRPFTGVEAGKANGSAGNFRGDFTVDIWHTVGWNDPGDWMNYTRDFPAGSYNIFGHLSSGGAAIDAAVSVVTSGVGTSTQETEMIGRFRPGRGTAGWDSLEIFPLVDSDEVGATSPLAVVDLDGLTTLRYSSIGGNNDNDYLVFIPASDEVISEITGVVLNGDGTVTIEGSGTAGASATASSSLSDYTGNIALPATVDATEAAQFYAPN